MSEPYHSEHDAMISQTEYSTQDYIRPNERMMQAFQKQSRYRDAMKPTRETQEILVIFYDSSKIDWQRFVYLESPSTFTDDLPF